MIVIGIFEVTELSPGRWRAVNTRTEFVHVTYGTEAEIRPLLEKQSVDWEKRLADAEAKRPGKRMQDRASDRWKNRTLAPLKKNPQIPVKES